MSKIKNAKGRIDGESGYTRVLKNDKLGFLLSKVQSTVIANGTELEKLILSRCNKINDLTAFIEETTKSLTNEGVYVCPKKIYGKSKYVVFDRDNKKIEPDLLIFIIEQNRICKIVELKDGDAFDTKKSAIEKQHLEEFVQKFGSKIPFVAEYYICCFNQLNKNVIYIGFKKDFEMEHILTGKELCDILKIDYNEIIEIRKKDAEENFNYFIEEALKIDEVRETVRKYLL